MYLLYSIISSCHSTFQIYNGPGKFEIHDRQLTNLFDGRAKLHKFDIDGPSSKVHFSSRFLETKLYQANNGSVFTPSIFIGDVIPPLSLYERVMSVINGYDNTNINVIEFHDELLATGELWLWNKFDRVTLGDIESVDPPYPLHWIYNTFIPTGGAHPLKDANGNLITLLSLQSTIPIQSDLINIIRIKSLNDREVVTSIPVIRAPNIHSFAMTSRYVILFADPMYKNIFSL